MALLNELLTEKMRPKELSKIILSERVRKSIGNGELNQNYLCVGNAGIGKTSIAKILATGRHTLYLNTSLDRGIGTVRNAITEFASTRSAFKVEKNDFKVIILDELDGATGEYYESLRATMEKFTDNVRFIATCNYLNKIPEPIKSRFFVINFNPQDKSEEEELYVLYKKRIKNVCDKLLHIQFESDEVINEFLKKTFPDLRQIFSRLQDFHTSGVKVVTVDDIKRTAFTFQELYEMIVGKPSPHENYKFIMSEYVSKVEDVFTSLSVEFPNWIHDNKPNLEVKLPQILMTVPDWEFKSKFLNDPPTGLVACVMNLQQICNPT